MEWPKRARTVNWESGVLTLDGEKQFEIPELTAEIMEQLAAYTLVGFHVKGYPVTDELLAPFAGHKSMANFGVEDGALTDACFPIFSTRANGVEQISVQGSAIFASYHRRLRVDETFLLQLPHILCHRIFTHADRMTDGFVTGVALVGLPILAPEQIGIEGDLTKIQTDAEYLVWYHKIVFLCTALGPFVETQFIPPVLS